MSYTVTRVGSNIILKYDSDVHYMWPANDFNTIDFDFNSKRIKVGSANFDITLDYTLCTNPSGSTSKYDLMSKLCSLSDIEPTISELELSLNNILGKTSGLFFGRNETVGTSSEDIWIGGGDYSFLTGATTLEIISNNAQDDDTGLGARTVLINGLDGSCVEQSEVISLTGSGTVTTTNSYLRLVSAYVATCGTNRGSNYNDINIQSTGSNLEVGRIGGGYGTINTSNYGIGRTQLGIYTVPVGKTLYITSLYVNVDNTKTANVSLYCLNNIDNVTPPTSPRTLLAQIDGMTNFRDKQLTSYFAITEKSDIWFRGSLTSGTAGIDVQFEYYLVDN